MSRKGLMVGGGVYLAICFMYWLLGQHPRGGDMPFGAEIFLYPVVMFPLGLIGLISPATVGRLGNWANEMFGSYRALDWIPIVGNFFLWGIAGGIIGRIWRRKA